MNNKRIVQTKKNAHPTSTPLPARLRVRPFFGPEPLREAELPGLKNQLANSLSLGHHFDAVPVQVGPEGGQAPPAVESAINRARGGGQSLDRAVQELMGEVMGHDFSEVRVHTDSEADTLNRQLSARAFTTGPDIFFQRGEYNPGLESGRGLLAHELSHVVQQSNGRVTGDGGGMTVRPAGDALEQEADAMGREATQPKSVSPLQRAAADPAMAVPAGTLAVERMYGNRATQRSMQSTGAPTQGPTPTRKPEGRSIAKAVIQRTGVGGNVTEEQLQENQADMCNKAVCYALKVAGKIKSKAVEELFQNTPEVRDYAQQNGTRILSNEWDKVASIPENAVIYIQKGAPGFHHVMLADGDGYAYGRNNGDGFGLENWIVWQKVNLSAFNGFLNDNREMTLWYFQL